MDYKYFINDLSIVAMIVRKSIYTDLLKRNNSGLSSIFFFWFLNRDFFFLKSIATLLTIAKKNSELKPKPQVHLRNFLNV